MALSATTASAFLSACASAPAPEGLEDLRAPAGVSVQHKVAYYPVTGSDKRTMRPQLRLPDGSAGSSRYAGYYEYTISWRYQTKSDRGLCSVDRATVTLNGTVTIPEWTPPAGVDSQLVSDWSRFRKALAAHEQGHRALAYAGAGRVLRAIERMPMQSCASIAESVRRTANPILDELKQKQAQYDRDTRHGILQGSAF